MQRVMCMYLPELAIERLWRERPELRDKPIALYDPAAARGPRVVACSAPAVRSGVRPGMPLAEALAVERRLHAQEHDPAGDLRTLGELAQWAERFGPTVGLEEGPAPRCLLVDVSGCAALFRGEARLLARAARALGERGWSARIAIAATIGAAWALAHHGDTPCLAESDRTSDALLPLPAAALRLPEDAVCLLEELGIERIGQLLELPRSGLPARFGPLVLRRLDQALGHLPEVLVPHRIRPEVHAVYPFEYPTDRLDALSYALDRLTEQIHRALRERNGGAHRLECWLYHDAAEPIRIDVGLFRPSRSPRHLGTLVRARLERLQIVEPVCAMCLRVPAEAPLPEGQPELFGTERPGESRELSAFIDRLSSQLGRDAVTRPTLVADAQPEYACRYEPVIRGEQERNKRVRGAASSAEASSRGPALRAASSSRAATLPCAAGLSIVSPVGGEDPCHAAGPSSPVRRPLRLWPVPVPIRALSVTPDGPPAWFRWAGAGHRIARSWGPERIETGWWRERDVHRDYYVVETDTGARFWLFRRRDDDRWFLHGCFD